MEHEPGEEHTASGRHCSGATIAPHRAQECRRRLVLIDLQVRWGSGARRPRAAAGNENISNEALQSGMRSIVGSESLFGVQWRNVVGKRFGALQWSGGLEC